PPRQTTVFPPSPAAGMMCGTICASAPNIVSITRYPVSARAATGAGEVGFSTLPSGADTSIQRKTPALFGMSPRSAHLTLRNVFDFVNESVELIAARTCFELPLQ